MPKTIHSNVAKHREKIRRLMVAFQDKQKAVLNQMFHDNKLNDWENFKNLAPMRSDLRKLVERATVGKEPGLEAEICLKSCMIAYIHDEELRRQVEAQW